jgi:hypothetical protein
VDGPNVIVAVAGGQSGVLLTALLRSCSFMLLMSTLLTLVTRMIIGVGGVGGTGVVGTGVVGTGVVGTGVVGTGVVGTGVVGTGVVGTGVVGTGVVGGGVGVG